MRLSLHMELTPASPIRGVCGVPPAPLVRGSEYPRLQTWLIERLGEAELEA